MTTHTRRLVATAVASAALAGAAGAAIYAAVAPPSARTVTTVTGAMPIAQTTSSGLSVGQIYARTKNSIVEVDVTAAATSPSPFGGSGTQQAEGTGFVYDTKGDIVTNEHVVAGASSITVKFQDGTVAKAKVVGVDASTDLAVIHVDVSSSLLHPLTLGDSSAVSVGDGVVAIGNPFGLDDSVTTGIVSAVGREITSPNNTPIENAIQTDAAINHGNSGGPLFDLRGDVIGVTAQIESDSGGNDGVGFAIPSNTVKTVAAQLIATGKATHALLGVKVQTIPSSAASTLGSSAGVAVSSVEPGTAASRAGLHGATGTKTVAGVGYPTGGDVITAFDGTKVTTAAQLRGLVANEQAGTKVQLTVRHAGHARTVTVTLGARSS
jgi:putative serine protease PepD